MHTQCTVYSVIYKTASDSTLRNCQHSSSKLFTNLQTELLQVGQSCKVCTLQLSQEKHDVTKLNLHFSEQVNISYDVRVLAGKLACQLHHQDEGNDKVHACTFCSLGNAHHQALHGMIASFLLSWVLSLATRIKQDTQLSWQGLGDGMHTDLVHVRSCR